MNKQLTILTLMIIGLCSCGQTNKITPVNNDIDTEKNSTQQPLQKPLTYSLDQHIDTDTTYRNASGKGITIQNSFPKGGAPLEPGGIIGYKDTNGIRYGNGNFWTRIVNTTDKALELSINFPTDSIKITPPPDSYFRLFLPPDTLTIDKVSKYNYGLEGLKTYLDNHFDDPAKLKKTIQPKEELMFYVTLLMHVPDNGPVRTGFVLKGQKLFYRVSINPFDTVLIPCGKLVSHL